MMNATEQLSDEWLSLDDLVSEKTDAVLYVRVKDEILGGISNGDVVVINRNSVPQQGDIVLKTVGDRFVFTYFDGRRGLRLVTDQPIADAWKIYGVATFVLKKLKQL